MKNLIEFFLLACWFIIGCVLFSFFYVWVILGERHEDPNAVGAHNDYTIICENGLRYKIRHSAAFPVLNSDGTQAKCDTIY